MDESIEGYEFSYGEQMIGDWTFLNIDGVVQLESRSVASEGVMHN